MAPHIGATSCTSFRICQWKLVFEELDDFICIRTVWLGRAAEKGSAGRESVNFWRKCQKSFECNQSRKWADGRVALRAPEGAPAQRTARLWEIQSKVNNERRHWHQPPPVQSKRAPQRRHIVDVAYYRGPGPLAAALWGINRQLPPCSSGGNPNRRKASDTWGLTSGLMSRNCDDKQPFKRGRHPSRWVAPSFEYLYRWRAPSSKGRG